MARKKLSTVQVVVLVVGYSTIGLFGFWLAPARADSAPAPEIAVTSAPDEVPKPAEPLVPFEKHPTGEGAVPFSELRATPPRPLTAGELSSGSLSAARYREVATDTQESVEKAGAWANKAHGPQTTAAWSKVTDQGVARAEEASARYAAGLAPGADDLGVR